MYIKSGREGSGIFSKKTVGSLFETEECALKIESQTNQLIYGISYQNHCDQSHCPNIDKTFWLNLTYGIL